MGRQVKTQRIIDETRAMLEKDQQGRIENGYGVLPDHIDLIYHQAAGRGIVEKSRSGWRAFVKAINAAMDEGTIPREWQTFGDKNR